MKILYKIIIAVSFGNCFSYTGHFSFVLGLIVVACFVLAHKYCVVVVAVLFICQPILQTYDDDDDGGSDVFVVISAEGDTSCDKLSRVVSVESELRETEQLSLHHDVEDSCIVHSTAVNNEQLKQLVIPVNQLVNAADNRRVNSSNCHNSDPSPLKLPEFEHFLTDMHRPSSRLVTELGASCDAVDQLETEQAEFRDVPARFQPNITWPAASDVKSSVTLSDSESQHSNRPTRDCNSDSHKYKSTETTNVSSCVGNKKNLSVDSHGEMSRRPLLAAAASTDHENSRLNLTSSDLLLQLASLSHQLAAQVIKQTKRATSKRIPSALVCQLC